MQTLADRALALAAQARERPDPKLLIAQAHPDFAEWARDYRRVFGGTELRLVQERGGRVLYGEPAKGTWVRVSDPPLVKERKRGNR